MLKAFLVMENDFLYNDEFNFNVTEPGTCSNPKRIFFTRLEAESCALEIARTALRGQPLSTWGFYPGDLSSLNDETLFVTRLSNITGNKFSDVTDAIHSELPENLNDETVQALLELCDRLIVTVIVEATITDEQALLEAQQTLENGILNDRSSMDWFSSEADYIPRYTLSAERIGQITGLFNVPFEPYEDVS
jgi:hypothetical protein